MSTPAGDDLVGNATIRVDGDTDPAMRAMRRFTRDANGQLRDLRGRFASESRLISRSVNRITAAIEGAAGSLKPLAVAAAPAAAALAPLALQAAAAGAAFGAFTAAIVPQILAMAEVTDAQEKYTDAVAQYGATSAQAAEAQRQYVRMLNELPPATQEATGALLLLQDTFTDWSDEVSAFTMEPVTKSLGIVDAIIPRLTPLVEGSANQFDRLVTVAGGAINTPGFDALADRFSVFANESLKTAVDGVIHLSRRLAEGDTSGPIRAFMEFARANGPALRELLGNVAQAVGTLAEASAEAGPGMLALVNAAAGLVAALPPGVVAVALQLSVALKAVSLAGAGVAAVAGGVGKLRDSLIALQAASVAAGGGLAGLRAAFLSLGVAARASVVVAGLAAITLTLKELSEIGQDAPPDIDRMTTSLGELARTGKLSGEAARVLGEDFDKLGESLSTLARPSNLDKAQQFLTSLIGMDSTPVKTAKEDFEALDQGLTNLLQGGKAELAAAALKTAIENLQEQGFTADEVSGQLDSYNAALADVAFEQQLTAQSMGFFGQQALDVQAKLNAQKQAADGLRQSLIALNQVNITASNAQIALEAAIDNASESAQKNGKTLDLNTEKGRANRTALNQLASATNEATAAILEQTGSNIEAGKAADRGRQQLIAQAMQMGLNKQQAKALADQILQVPDKTARLKGDLKDLEAKLGVARKDLASVPDSRKAQVRARIDQLEAQVADAKNLLASLRDKTIRINANLYLTGSAAARAAVSQSGAGRIFERAQGGLVGAYASGGPVRGYPHGGSVNGPGTATSDSVPAMLSDGEFVVRAAAVRRYGAGLFEQLNERRAPALAHGGAVRSGGRGVAPVTVVNNIYLQNRGVLGSPFEVENWLIGALDNARRTGRLPAMNGS